LAFRDVCKQRTRSQLPTMQTASLETKLAQLIPVSLAVLAGARGLSHRLVTLALLAAIAAAAPESLRRPALAAVLSSWEFDPTANQLQLMVEQGVKPTYAVLNQPPRIVVELPKTQLATRTSQKTYSGAVRQIQVEESGAGQVRVVMEFSPEVILNPGQVRLLKVAAPVSTGAFQERWVLNFSISDSGSVPAPAPNPAPNLSPNLTPNLAPNLSPNPAPNLAPVSQIPSPLPSFGVPPAANFPPLGAPSASSPPPPPLWPGPLPGLPTERSAIPSLPPAPIVSVPPLQRRSPSPMTAAVSASVFLPARTLLNLRYTGEAVLALTPGSQLQEVLLLDSEIRDSSGNVVVPAGTQVIGRFETNLRGSRFIAQGISLFSRNVRLEAESERFSQLSALQPGQIVRVRLKEALSP
jgi:N-acetylmuramoyl-L-alanine amidase